MKIKLHYLEAGSFRNAMPELDIKKASRIYWVGSIAVKDKDSVKSFMALAEKGDIVGLTRFGVIGGDLLYAIITEVNCVYKLYVINSPEDFYGAEQCIYSRVVEDINIEGYQLNADQEEALKKLRGECKMTFLDFVKAVLFIR